MLSSDGARGAPVVLVVEDSPDDEALLVRALRTSEIAMKVVVVRDGEAALHYLLAPGADRSRLPVLVLSDLKLPRIDGLELLRQLRADARTRMIPVVLFSSSAQDDDLRRAYTLGANSYVQKPVDSRAFAETVRQLGSYWLALNEPVPADASRRPDREA